MWNLDFLMRSDVYLAATQNILKQCKYFCSDFSQAHVFFSEHSNTGLYKSKQGQCFFVYLLCEK